MKYPLLTLSLLFVSGLLFAEGTHTFSSLELTDIEKKYENIKNVIATKKNILGKEVISVAISGKYEITDDKEIIAYLIYLVKKQQEDIDSIYALINTKGINK